MSRGFQASSAWAIVTACTLCLVLFASVDTLRAEPIAVIVSEMERLGFEPLPGQPSLEVPFETEGRRGSHVVGLLPATEGESPVGSPAILIGTRIEETAGLKTAEKVAAAATRRRPVVVAFWSDEGSPRVGVPEGHLLACIHLGGMGSISSNRLEILGAGTSPAWRGVVERANVPVGFDIQIEDAPAPAGVSVGFRPTAVPAITLLAADADHPSGSHDEAEPLDPEEAGRVAKFVALLVRRLDGLENPPEYVAFDPQKGKPKPQKQSAYTGTIPDYMAEVEGLRLSGVMEDGPAEKAGLIEGDVIVEFAGKPIGDIYGYRDALNDVEVGRPIQVVFMREGERHEVTLIPTARP